MNAKIAKIRKFAHDHQLFLAYTAGCVVTSTAMYVLLKDTHFLELTKQQAEILKNGGTVVYELKDQTLHLVNVAAEEALTAL